jgi:hypothetical protein
MPTAQLAEELVLEHVNDGDLLARVLKPYRPHCRYLQSATVSVETAADAEARVSAVCELEIPESCYIDDTGHFNSVEFNICYNQMLYYTVAMAVQEKIVKPFSGWTMEDYWQRQLADFLITDFRSTFKRQMRGRRFRGEIEIANVLEWEGNDLRPALIVLPTVCRYWDDHGGEARGEVRIAITNPPAQSSSEARNV